MDHDDLAVAWRAPSLVQAGAHLGLSVTDACGRTDCRMMIALDVRSTNESIRQALKYRLRSRALKDRKRSQMSKSSVPYIVHRTHKLCQSPKEKGRRGMGGPYFTKPLAFGDGGASSTTPTNKRFKTFPRNSNIGFLIN